MSNETLDLLLKFVIAMTALISPIIVIILQKKIATKLEQVSTVAEKTHILVNSEHGTALKSLALCLRVVADGSPTTVNEEAAEKAEKASSEHEKNQATSDKL